jgi:superoxide dismutase, Cu-Zn family
MIPDPHVLKMESVMKFERTKFLATAAAAALMLLSTGFVAGQSPDPGSATAVLHDVDGIEVGTVTWTQADGGVSVAVTVQGLPPGFHGFHVHTVGECIAPFTSAGVHLNPGETDHPGHAADQPVLLVNADGTGAASFVTDRYAVADLLGAAVIVHANPDNYANIPERYQAPGPSASPVASAEPLMVPGPDAATLATGDSGPRIACGVIESETAPIQ